MRYPWLGALLCALSSACVDLPEVDDGGGGAMAGRIEKGPLLPGTTVWVQELDLDLSPSLATAFTEIRDETGAFATELRTSALAEVRAEGFFFDEVRGEVSRGPIALSALVAAGEPASVNVLTTLAGPRIRRLVADGLPFVRARAQAEAELRAAFRLPVTEDAFSASSLRSDGGLLAVSAGIAGAASFFAPTDDERAAFLSRSLARMRADFAADGVVRDSAFPGLRTALRYVDAVHVRELLNSYYADAGVDIDPVPPFDGYLDSDGDGIPNAADPVVEWSHLSALDGCRFTELTTTRLLVSCDGELHSLRPSDGATSSIALPESWQSSWKWDGVHPLLGERALLLRGYDVGQAEETQVLWQLYHAAHDAVVDGPCVGPADHCLPIDAGLPLIIHPLPTGDVVLLVVTGDERAPYILTTAEGRPLKAGVFEVGESFSARTVTVLLDGRLLVSGLESRVLDPSTGTATLLDWTDELTTPFPVALPGGRVLARTYAEPGEGLVVLDLAAERSYSVDALPGARHPGYVPAGALSVGWKFGRGGAPDSLEVIDADTRRAWAVPLPVSFGWVSKRRPVALADGTVYVRGQDGATYRLSLLR